MLMPTVARRGVRRLGRVSRGSPPRAASGPMTPPSNLGRRRVERAILLAKPKEPERSRTALAKSSSLDAILNSNAGKTPLRSLAAPARLGTKTSDIGSDVSCIIREAGALGAGLARPPPPAQRRSRQRVRKAQHAAGDGCDSVALPPGVGSIVRQEGREPRRSRSTRRLRRGGTGAT